MMPTAAQTERLRILERKMLVFVTRSKEKYPCALGGLGGRELSELEEIYRAKKHFINAEFVREYGKTRI